MLNNSRWFRMILVLALGLVLALAIGVAAAQEDAPQPFLGFAFEPDADGVLVTRVLPGGPADTAGLETGDVITAVNGDTVTAEDIVTTIEGLSVGDEIELNVVREGDTVDLTATLGARDDFMQEFEGRFPGRGNRPDMPFGFPGEMRRVYLGVALDPEAEGVVIAEVAPDSPAAEAGLQVGDEITAINGEAVTAPRAAVELIQALNAGDTVTLDITRDGEAQTVEATLAEAEPRMNIPGFGMNGDAILYNQVDNTWVVANVAEDGALAAAGLQSGDQITAIEGTESLEPAALSDYLNTLTDDDTVTVTVNRAGETQEIDVSVGALKPLAEMPAFGFGGRRGDRGFEFGIPGRTAGIQLGVAFTTLNAEVAAEQGIDVTEGALITEVAPETPAAEAGLQVDDIVTAVNGEAVDEEHTLRDRLVAYEPEDTVTLTVLRGGESLDIDVTLAAPNMPQGFPFGEDMESFFGAPELIPAEPAGPMA